MFSTSKVCATTSPLQSLEVKEFAFVPIMPDLVPA
jgi:hypothetical protein